MKILVAEDDPQSSEFLRKGLTQEGHQVECLADGRDVLAACLYNPFDMLILDRMMPGMDGLTVLKTLRAADRHMPVLFLTAMGDVDDRVEGLLAGGDDYLVKPFHFSELVARVTSLARRPQQNAPATTLAVHDLELDLLERTATRAGTSIDLQAKEFALLEILMRNAGRIVTKTMLLERVWDFNFDPKTTVVETHMSRLRAKVDKPFETAADPHHPQQRIFDACAALASFRASPSARRCCSCWSSRMVLGVAGWAILDVTRSAMLEQTKSYIQEDVGPAARRQGHRRRARADALHRQRRRHPLRQAVRLRPVRAERPAHRRQRRARCRPSAAGAARARSPARPPTTRRSSPMSKSSTTASSSSAARSTPATSCTGSILNALIISGVVICAAALLIGYLLSRGVSIKARR